MSTEGEASVIVNSNVAIPPTMPNTVSSPMTDTVGGTVCIKKWNVFMHDNIIIKHTSAK